MPTSPTQLFPPSWTSIDQRSSIFSVFFTHRGCFNRVGQVSFGVARLWLKLRMAHHPLCSPLHHNVLRTEALLFARSVHVCKPVRSVTSVFDSRYGLVTECFKTVSRNCLLCTTFGRTETLHADLSPDLMAPGRKGHLSRTR